MTLDEYMAEDCSVFYRFDDAHRFRLLQEATGRIDDLRSDRDSWMEQCMDARRVWHEDHQRLELETKAHRIDCERLTARIAELQAERDCWRTLARVARISG